MADNGNLTLKNTSNLSTDNNKKEAITDDGKRAQFEIKKTEDKKGFTIRSTLVNKYLSLKSTRVNGANTDSSTSNPLTYSFGLNDNITANEVFYPSNYNYYSTSYLTNINNGSSLLPEKFCINCEELQLAANFDRDQYKKIVNNITEDTIRKQLNSLAGTSTTPTPANNNKVLNTNDIIKKTAKLSSALDSLSSSNSNNIFIPSAVSAHNPAFLLPKGKVRFKYYLGGEDLYVAITDINELKYLSFTPIPLEGASNRSLRFDSKNLNRYTFFKVIKNEVPKEKSNDPNILIDDNIINSSISLVNEFGEYISIDESNKISLVSNRDNNNKYSTSLINMEINTEFADALTLTTKTITKRLFGQVCDIGKDVLNKKQNKKLSTLGKRKFKVHVNSNVLYARKLEEEMLEKKRREREENKNSLANSDLVEKKLRIKDLEGKTKKELKEIVAKNRKREEVKLD